MNFNRKFINFYAVTTTLETALSLRYYAKRLNLLMIRS